MTLYQDLKRVLIAIIDKAQSEGELDREFLISELIDPLLVERIATNADAMAIIVEFIEADRLPDLHEAKENWLELAQALAFFAFMEDTDGYVRCVPPPPALE